MAMAMISGFGSKKDALSFCVKLSSNCKPSFGAGTEAEG